jgi:hypothetical protein
MTLAKASVLAAILVGAVALGIVYGPTLHDKWESRGTNASAVSESQPAPAPAPAPTKRVQRTVRARTERPDAEMVMPRGAVRSVQPEVWEPDLQKRAKQVLNPGANLELAAADFQSVQQFMTVAHAARNTGVPFMVLKDRVVNQKATLVDAIHEFKPDVDAKSEVTRAKAAAEQDLGAE